MKPCAPNLLSGAALPPTVQLPGSFGREALPDGARWDVDEQGEPCIIVDLTKVPRNMRRKALARFPRCGEIPKGPRRRKPPSKRKQNTDEKEELMSMEIMGHPWATGRGGRTIAKRRTGNNLRVVAALTCSTEGCGRTDEVKHRAVLPPEVLNKRFLQKGWKLDPPICPDCVQQPKEEEMTDSPTTTATVSEKAGLAQAKVFKLLGLHFDETKGRYANGYSDDKIAKETGCALVFVQNCRKECFGDLKEDPAIAELRADIEALEGLISESITDLQQQLAGLKAKLARVSQ